jgi:hypothetical protein
MLCANMQLMANMHTGECPMFVASRLKVVGTTTAAATPSRVNLRAITITTELRRKIQLLTIGRAVDTF